jgi:integrase
MMKTFAAFLSELLGDLQSQGRTGTRNNYSSVSRSVLGFSGNADLTLKEPFTKDFLYRYQKYLQDRGCCYNTISSYMRVLRAICNKARKRGLISVESDLFENLFTGSEPTRKRALQGEAILDLNEVDLEDHPHLTTSRELFILLFHLQGMSYVDLAHLRKSDLKSDPEGDYITYRRRKTGGLIPVKILPAARELLERHLSTDEHSPYLLSILTPDGRDLTKQYRAALRRFNRHLKTLGELIGIKENLTSYVARHSWATAAYHIGVPTAVISEAMGHKTEEVTRVYLASFDTGMLDYANRMVWESLFANKTTHKQANKQNKKANKQNRKANRQPPKDKQEWIRSVSFFIGERHYCATKVKRTF